MLFYYTILLVELEDNNLKNSLKQLHIHGWNFDKLSQSKNRSLCEEDLKPLLNHKSQPSDTPFFKLMNEYLLRLINTAPILELVEIDVTSDEGQATASIDTDDESVAAKLIKQCDKDSSAQVILDFFNLQLMYLQHLLIDDWFFKLIYRLLQKCFALC